MKIKIRNIIKRMNRENDVTVILTTHDISDIEALCHRIVIIDQGVIIFNDSMHKMKQLVGTERKTIEITTKDVIGDELLSNIRQGFIKENVLFNLVTNKKMEIIYDRNEVDIDMLLMKIMRNTKVIDIDTSDVRIENIIKQVYEGKLL